LSRDAASATATAEAGEAPGSGVASGWSQLVASAKGPEVASLASSSQSSDGIQAPSLLSNPQKDVTFHRNTQAEVRAAEDDSAKVLHTAQQLNATPRSVLAREV